MLQFDKTHTLIQSTYKNILENFNPGLKQLITTGKALQKGYHNVTAYAKTYLACLYDLAHSAQACEGTNEIGNSLVQVADAYTFINQQIIDSIKFFHSELLIPLKAKQENEFRHVQICYDKYLTGYKYHCNRLNKAESSLAKAKKKPKPKYGFNQKEIQYTREVKECSSILEDYLGKNLRLALLEERKRYCYLLSRLIATSHDNAVKHAKARENLTNRIREWAALCKSPHILPPSSEKFIRDLGFSDGSSAVVEDSSDTSDAGRRATLTGDGQTDRHLEGCSDWTDSKPDLSREELFKRYSTVPTATTSLFNFALEPNAGSVSHSNRHTLLQLRAAYAYTGDSDTQLSLEVGDLVSVVDAGNHDGWQYGRNTRTGKFGWFPVSYTEIAELETLKTLTERVSSIENMIESQMTASLSGSTPSSPMLGASRIKHSSPPLYTPSLEPVHEHIPPPDGFCDEADRRMNRRPSSNVPPGVAPHPTNYKPTGTSCQAAGADPTPASAAGLGSQSETSQTEYSKVPTSTVESSPSGSKVQKPNRPQSLPVVPAGGATRTSTDVTRDLLATRQSIDVTSAHSTLAATQSNHRKTFFGAQDPPRPPPHSTSSQHEAPTSPPPSLPLSPAKPPLSGKTHEYAAPYSLSVVYAQPKISNPNPATPPQSASGLGSSTSLASKPSPYASTCVLNTDYSKHISGGETKEATSTSVSAVPPPPPPPPPLDASLYVRYTQTSKARIKKTASVNSNG